MSPFAASFSTCSRASSGKWSSNFAIWFSSAAVRWSMSAFSVRTDERTSLFSAKAVSKLTGEGRAAVEAEMGAEVMPRVFVGVVAAYRGMFVEDDDDDKVVPKSSGFEV